MDSRTFSQTPGKQGQSQHLRECVQEGKLVQDSLKMRVTNQGEIV